MVTFTYELGKTNAKGYTPIYIRVCVDRPYKRIRFFSDAAPSDITKKGEIKNGVQKYLIDTVEINKILFLEFSEKCFLSKISSNISV